MPSVRFRRCNPIAIRKGERNHRGTEMHRGSQRKAEKKEYDLDSSRRAGNRQMSNTKGRAEIPSLCSLFSAFLCEPLCISVPLWLRSLAHNRSDVTFRRDWVAALTLCLSPDGPVYQNRGP